MLRFGSNKENRQQVRNEAQQPIQRPPSRLMPLHSTKLLWLTTAIYKYNLSQCPTRNPIKRYIDRYKTEYNASDTSSQPTGVTITIFPSPDHYFIHIIWVYAFHH